MKPIRSLLIQRTPAGSSFRLFYSQNTEHAHFKNFRPASLKRMLSTVSSSYSNLKVAIEKRQTERFSREREAEAFRQKERKDTTDDKNFNQTKTRIIFEMLVMSLSTKRDIIIRKITQVSHETSMAEEQECMG